MMATKLLSLDNMEAVAIIFTHKKGVSDHERDILVTKDPMDWSDQLTRWGYHMKRAEPIELDGFGKHYYAIGVSDCFDPPLCVVRADHEGDAQDAFLSEKDWADWDQDTIDCSVRDDGEEKTFEHLTPTDRGTWAETEGIVIWEVYPYRAEFV